MVTAQCPHAPVTLHYRACGRCRDALPGHYLCFSSNDKCNNALLHRTGGSSIPSGRRRILVQGTPALHRAMLGRQFSCNVKSKVIIE